MYLFDNFDKERGGGTKKGEKNQLVNALGGVISLICSTLRSGSRMSGEQVNLKLSSLFAHTHTHTHTHTQANTHTPGAYEGKEHTSRLYPK